MERPLVQRSRRPNPSSTDYARSGRICSRARIPFLLHNAAIQQQLSCPRTGLALVICLHLSPLVCLLRWSFISRYQGRCNGEKGILGSGNCLSFCPVYLLILLSFFQIQYGV
jgi:hypothetical protein